MKNSIEKHILRVFAITLAIVIVTSVALTYYNAYVSELQRCRAYSRSATYMTKEILDDYGLLELEKPDNERLYREARGRLRSICIAFELTYLYVYTVDEKEVRHYVLVVAFDDEKEKMVEEVRGLGSVSDDPLDLHEKAALRGEENGTEDIQNTKFGKESSWITPYLDEKEEVIALVGADIGMEVRNSSIARHLIALLVPAVIMLSLAFVTLYIITKRKVIKPLLAISSRMEMFDPEKENEPILIHSEDEIQRIADSFNKMSVDIRTYIQHIETITAQQESDRAQMEIARRIQYGIVPEVFHYFGNGVDAGGLMRSAKEVGGDFYDFFTLEDGRCCAMIGDVSGKGIAGALFMAVVRFLIRERLTHYGDPALTLNSVNEELCKHNPEGMFVTAFALILDPATGNVQFANAGHTPPVLMKVGSAADQMTDSGSPQSALSAGREGKRVEYLSPDPGIVLGIFEDAGIITETLTLGRGEGIFLYTDGVTEAVNISNDFYGSDRLLTVIRENNWSDSRVVTDCVEKSIVEFASGCEQFDDITVLAVFNRGDT